MNQASPHSRRLRLIAWTLVAMYLGLAVTLTHMPKPPSEFQAYSDKLLHATGYFVYGALLYTAMGLTLPRTRLMWAIVWGILAAWAAIDELTQPMFGRDCDIHDWLADVAGVALAVTLLGVARYFAAPRRRRFSFS